MGTPFPVSSRACRGTAKRSAKPISIGTSARHSRPSSPERSLDSGLRPPLGMTESERNQFMLLYHSVSFEST